MLIYATATDHINKHPYSATVAAYAQVVHREVEMGIFFAPIYEAFDPNLPQRSMITIAKMIEYYISRVSFTILNDYDILLILHQIDAYVAEVYPMREMADVRKYLVHTLHFRTWVYRTFRKILNRRPEWKHAYEGKSNVFQMIAKLYRDIGFTDNAPQLFYEQLEICPTLRENNDTTFMIPHNSGQRAVQTLDMSKNGGSIYGG